MRRMDRYKDEEEAQSRIDLNQELYQNVSNNTIYANITDVIQLEKPTNKCRNIKM